MTYQQWRDMWEKEQMSRPISEREEKAMHLWYVLLHANGKGFIVAHEYDDPTVGIDYIHVIAQFLDESFEER